MTSSLKVAPLLTLPVLEMRYLKHLRFNNIDGEDLTPLQMQQLINAARRRGQMEERQGRLL